MIAYRLVSPNESEIMFGIDATSEKSVEKLRRGINNMRPYKEVVPHYKNDKFAFLSLEAFKYFLNNRCNINIEDIRELEKLGYYVSIINLSVYTRGLSKILCTYFDDEVVEPVKEVHLTELFENADSLDYGDFFTLPHPKEFIKECKDQYYKNVKFKK